MTHKTTKSDALTPASSPQKTEKEELTNRLGLLPTEFGGAVGPEPTRYGDWEHKGRCTDF